MSYLFHKESFHFGAITEKCSKMREKCEDLMKKVSNVYSKN